MMQKVTLRKAEGHLFLTTLHHWHKQTTALVLTYAIDIYKKCGKPRPKSLFPTYSYRTGQYVRTNTQLIFDLCLSELIELVDGNFLLVELDDALESGNELDIEGALNERVDVLALLHHLLNIVVEILLWDV